MSAPLIEIDASSSVAPFAQLHEQISTIIATGALVVGARLPAVRQLAADLGVAPGTVARAYRELEHAGVIETRGRHGTFVRAPVALAIADTDTELRSAARTFAVRAHQLGTSPEDAIEAVRTALSELQANVVSAPDAAG